jgi:hypothetical protein
MMDSLSQLKNFLNAASKDPRIGATHVSIYMSLFHCWLENDCQDPILVNRRGIMANAKISGVATYHKCIRELLEYGYIRYIPSNHPLCQSEVYIVKE